VPHGHVHEGFDCKPSTRMVARQGARMGWKRVAEENAAALSTSNDGGSLASLAGGNEPACYAAGARADVLGLLKCRATVR